MGDNYSYVYRRSDLEINNYQIAVVDDGSVDGLGVSGEVRIKGPKKLWHLTETVIEGPDGFKIEGEILHFMPYDVKVTREGTNFVAYFKADSF